MSTHKRLPVSSPVVQIERAEVIERLQAIQSKQRLLLETMREVRETQMQLAKEQQQLVDEWNQLTLQEASVQTGLPSTAIRRETGFEEE